MRLAGRIGAVRRQRRLFGNIAVRPEAAVNFVRRNMQVTLHVELTRRIEKNLRAKHIRPHERTAVLNRTIDMAFGCQVKHDLIPEPSPGVPVHDR